MKRPKDLYVLWQEYQHGVGGGKAAKDWTSREQGGDQFTYSRCLTFWNTVSLLIRRGHTADRAIDKVYAAYGRGLSVTQIINAMQGHKKNGGHPDLQE